MKPSHLFVGEALYAIQDKNKKSWLTFALLKSLPPFLFPTLLSSLDDVIYEQHLIVMLGLHTH